MPQLRLGLAQVDPVVGDLHLSYDVMELPADPGLVLIAFSAEAGTPDHDALQILGNWATTHELSHQDATPNDS